MAATLQHPTRTQTYENRANLPNLNPLAAYLFRLAVIKQSNLCVSADVTTTSQLFELAEEVGDSIILFKTHADIVTDFTDRTIRGLRDIAARKHFLIFEDRKFGDIGSTVQKQYTAGTFAIVRWAHIVNAHVFPGPAIITALQEAAEHALASSNARVDTEISADDLNGHAIHHLPIVYSSSSAQANGPTNGSTNRSTNRSTNGDTTPRSPTINGASGENAVSDEYGESQSFNYSARKPSIISVCSSITMRYENLAPPPSPGPKIPPRYPNESISAAIERLGPIPISRSLLLLAQMSSENNLLTPDFTQKSVAMAREHKEFVMGFIAQQGLNTEREDNFITMTPGVNLGSSGDGLGQQYNSPARIVRDQGSDIIIVGRGILNAEDKTEEAERYRKEGWRAYEERVGLRKLGG
ncbi:MAG: orotidine 5'-phosphate decarboxylase [Bogoriella megaspora]|nr:MAG: orotidine 5'-phosphate decarboxylase [Bogoriella megaspora]